MKIVHTADLHLTAGDGPRARCAFDALRKICALAKEQAAHLLVIAGDAFNSPADARDGGLIQRVRAEFDALVSTKVVLIPGNHETQGGGTFRSPDDFGRNCEVFLQDGVLALGCVRVHAFPFRPNARTAELFGNVGATKDDQWRIAVLHGTAVDLPVLALYAAQEESLEPGGDLLIKNADLARAGFRYAALGHIHKPGSWNLPNGGKAAYAGAPWCVTVREETPRSVVVAELDEATGSTRLELVALPTPRAVRRSFLVTPGGELAALSEVEAFFRSQPKDVWPVAYLEGLGDKGLLDRRKADLERHLAAEWPLPPEVRIRERDFRGFEGAKVPLLARHYFEALKVRLAGAQGEEREVLMRAAVLGWLALKQPAGRPEEDLLTKLEEAFR